MQNLCSFVPKHFVRSTDLKNKQELRDPLGSYPKQHKYMVPDGFRSIPFYEEFYNHLIKENSIIPISLGETFDFPKAKGIPFKISSCPQHWCGIWIIPQHRWQWGTLNLIAFTRSPYTEPFFFPSIHSLFIAYLTPLEMGSSYGWMLYFSSCSSLSPTGISHYRSSRASEYIKELYREIKKNTHMNNTIFFLGCRCPMPSLVLQ